MLDLDKAKETLAELEAMERGKLSPFFKRIEMDMSEAIEMWDSVVTLLESNKSLRERITLLHQALAGQETCNGGATAIEMGLTMEVNALRSKIRELEGEK